MKKIKFVILFIAVLALALCTYLLTRDESIPNQEEEVKDTSFVVKTVDEEIKEISLINTSGVFGFTKKDGEWMNVFTVEVKTSGNTIHAIESIIRETIALDKIEENVSSMGKYGIDKPSATVRYVTESGKEGFVKIGNSVVGAKYYFTVDDSSVYTMDASEAGIFLAGMQAFSDMTLTDLKIEDIKRVTVFSYGEEITVEKKKDSELMKEGADALFTYSLRSPVNENASPNDVQVLFEMIANISAAEYNPYASDEACGFDKSERYFSYEAVKETGRFVLGNTAEKGYTYVKKDGVKGAYKVADYLIDFVNYDAFKLVDKHIALYYFDEIESIKIDAFGENYELLLGDTVKVNGREIDKDTAQEFFRSLISLSYDGSVEKEVEEIKRDISITFVSNGKKDVTHYVEYDAMNYAIERSGAIEFTIQKKYVEKILSLVKEL